MTEWKEVTTEDLENHPELITRLARLESIVRGLVSMQGIDRTNTKYDVEGVRHTDAEQTESINLNASDIADNRTGIEESFEISLVNTDDIADLRTALEEVYEIVIEE